MCLIFIIITNTKKKKASEQINKQNEGVNSKRRPVKIVALITESAGEVSGEATQAPSRAWDTVLDVMRVKLSQVLYLRKRDAISVFVCSGSP